MKLYRLLSIAVLLVPYFGYGQVYEKHSEIGVLAGTAYYLGELNPSIQVLNELNPSLGIFYRKNTNKRYALRFGLDYSKISATDKINSIESGQLSFSTNLYEGYGLLEFNFLPYQINGHRSHSFSPFVFIGMAIFMVNPKIENSAPSSIVSEGTQISASIPFGLGFKFNLLRNIGLSVEWGVRKTFSDKVDGLVATNSDGFQISNTQNNDWYSILGISLNYKILTKFDNCPGVSN